MKAEQAKQIVRTSIDLPAELNRKLLDETGKTKRSRHAEMIYRLEKSFEMPPPPPRSAKEKTR